MVRRWPSSRCVLTWQGEREPSGSQCGGLTTSLKPEFLPQKHLLITAWCGVLGLQCMGLGGTSIQSVAEPVSCVCVFHIFLPCPLKVSLLAPKIKCSLWGTLLFPLPRSKKSPTSLVFNLYLLTFSSVHVKKTDFWSVCFLFSVRFGSCASCDGEGFAFLPDAPIPRH